jgi:hypothetical protein
MLSRYLPTLAPDPQFPFLSQETLKFKHSRKGLFRLKKFVCFAADQVRR